MKTRLLFSAIFTFCFCILSSQVPSGFNYQAIARDGSGNILANQALPVKIDIVTALTGGTLIYEESFPSIISNQSGLITLVVGTGTQTGGIAASFSAIDWKSQTLYLRTIIQYPGTTWTTMGTSQIWGVPYSLVAKDVAGPISKLGITGTTDLMDEALFEVKNKAGNTVFAVYNEGIRAYVGNGKAKGVKGGFSIGGYDASKSNSVYDIFVLSTDSARFYLDSKPQGGTKGVKGGFSVGGYDMTKGGTPVQNYLEVSKDSVRIYIDSNPATKGVKGGFSVGGYDMTKGSPGQYLRVTSDSTRIVTMDSVKGFGVSNSAAGNKSGYLKLNPSNYFIGYQAGLSNTIGLYNSFIGYKAGRSNTQGYYNIFMGHNSGYSNTTGDANIFMGDSAGYSNTVGYYNVYLGPFSGKQSANGFQNICIGSYSGYKTTTGNRNIFIGTSAGLENTEGWANVFVGNTVGMSNTTGSFNVFLGRAAGWRNTTGESNIFIGSTCGTHNTSGADNIYIGKQSGLMNETSGSNIFIGNYSGYSSTGGTENVFLGNSTGYNNIGGCDNTFLGHSSGNKNTSGNQNTYVGGFSGLSTTEGAGNTFLGFNSGINNITGSYNVILGVEAGYNSTGNSNVFIGNGAGYNETGSNKLYISNSATPNPLIYGDFAYGGGFLDFNGNVGIGMGTTAPAYKLTVNGTAWCSSGIWTGSDIRWKKNINGITGILASVMALNPVTYQWKTEEFPGMNFTNDTQIGLIAQDVEKLFPGLVMTDAKGYKSVSYEKLSVVLLEGMKEQQKQIETQQQEISELKTLVNSLIERQGKGK